MHEYRFCFGLYVARLDKNSLFIFRIWPFKAEILVPLNEISAVSTTQITPRKLRVMRVFTAGRGVWIPLAPQNLASDIFDLLSAEGKP